MKRVINFSGGKTSALMTILLKPTENDIVLFTDTGREHPLTYKFIDDFEKHEDIKVTRISYKGKFDGFLQSRDYKRIPNRMIRTCTDELKVKTSKRFLRKKGIFTYQNYIGFRFDEPKRVIKFKENFKRVKTLFPLYDQKITKEMVNQFWLNKSYNLDIPSILGNCDLCFLKGKNNIIKILQLYPELAEKWIKDEEESKRHFGHTYFPDVTYKGLLQMAQSQKSLFNLEDSLPAYSCSCTN
jgi:3'-phosphoadenosine 5'-phosphosulfate sulfotransferase (PAPS reductase)/FAD synthetase